MNKNIKDYRENELKYFVVGNLILILIGLGKINPIIKPTSDTSGFTILNTVLGSAIFAALIFIFVYISDNLMPSIYKERIIWLWQGLPGGRVFEQIDNLRDDRINNEDVKKEYSD